MSPVTIMTASKMIKPALATIDSNENILSETFFLSMMCTTQTMLLIFRNKNCWCER